MAWTLNKRSGLFDQAYSHSQYTERDHSMTAQVAELESEVEVTRAEVSRVRAALATASDGGALARERVA
eukprot:2065077-Pleurochrysis_carterae.AAC.1